MYLESSFCTTHAGFRNEDAENESVPYPEVQEEAPDSNPDGRALEAEPDGLEVEDLRRVLVRVDLTNWEIRLIYIYAMALLAIYLKYLTLDRLIHLRMLKNITLKIRNYYTAIVKALKQVPHVS